MSKLISFKRTFLNVITVKVASCSSTILQRDNYFSMKSVSRGNLSSSIRLFFLVFRFIKSSPFKCSALIQMSSDLNYCSSFQDLLRSWKFGQTTLIETEKWLQSQKSLIKKLELSAVLQVCFYMKSCAKVTSRVIRDV